MTFRRADDRLRSSELRCALDLAAQGQPEPLGSLLARLSGLPGPRPAFPLAQAVADAVALRPASEALAILEPLANDDAAPDTAAVFRPMVASWGYAALVRARAAEASSWSALVSLAADERAPVRDATARALASLASRDARGGDLLVERFATWMDDENERDAVPRDVRWSASATLLDALVTHGALQHVRDQAPLLAATSKLIAELANAPRAAERSDARRRALAALSSAAAAFVTSFRSEPDGVRWLEDELSRARHPDVRRAFETTLERLRRRSASESRETMDRLARALAASARPPRDPTRERRGTRRRGR